MFLILTNSQIFPHFLYYYAVGAPDALYFICQSVRPSVRPRLSLTWLPGRSSNVCSPLVQSLYYRAMLCVADYAVARCLSVPVAQLREAVEAAA